LIVTSELERVTGPVPTNASLGETAKIRLIGGEKSRLISLRRADPVVERSAFVGWMHDRALSAGVQVFWGAALAGVTLDRGFACLEISGPSGLRRVRVRDAIIGADGVRSQVAAMTGMPKPPTVSILQAEVPLPRSWDPRTTQVWFDPDETRFFYWLIPEAAGKAVAGVISEREADLPGLLRGFLVRQRLSPVRHQGARVAMYAPRLIPSATVGETRVCLVGDAAGQVKVTTVGGTVTGLLGAEAAVRAIVNQSSYARELRSLRRELDLHWRIRCFLDRLDGPGYAFLLSSLSDPVRGFLARHNRDSIAPVFWRLPLLQPKFLLLALRAWHPPRRRLRSSVSAPTPLFE